MFPHVLIGALHGNSIALKKGPKISGPFSNAIELPPGAIIQLRARNLLITESATFKGQILFTVESVGLGPIRGIRGTDYGLHTLHIFLPLPCFTTPGFKMRNRLRVPTASNHATSVHVKGRGRMSREYPC